MSRFPSSPFWLLLRLLLLRFSAFWRGLSINTGVFGVSVVRSAVVLVAVFATVLATCLAGWHVACLLGLALLPVLLTGRLYSVHAVAVSQQAGLQTSERRVVEVSCSVCPTVVVNGATVVRGGEGYEVVRVDSCADLERVSNRLPPVVRANVAEILGCGSARGYLRLDEVASIKERLSGVLPDGVLDDVLFFTTRRSLPSALKKKVVTYAVSMCLGTKFISSVLDAVSMALYGARHSGIISIPYTMEQRDKFCIDRLRKLGMSDDDIEQYKRLREKFRNPPAVAAYVYCSKHGTRYASLFGVTEQEVRLIRRRVGHEN